MVEPFPSISEILEARGGGTLNEVVERALACLVGEPLRTVHRAVDMIVLGFGEDALPTAWTYKGSDPERAARVERHNQTPIPRTRLHVQCPIRFDSSSGPLVGGHDIYNDAMPPHLRLAGDSWQEDVSNLFDVRVEQLQSWLDDSVSVVRDVLADRGGGFTLSLGDLSVVAGGAV
jgi:hypothetical protein